MTFVPQPTPAEPRIETVAVIDDGNPIKEAMLKKLRAHPEPEERAAWRKWFISEYGFPSSKLDDVSWAAWRARAGSSLIAEPEKAKLTKFVCDCGRKLLVEGQVIGKELAASPPSSPGAPQEQK